MKLLLEKKLQKDGCKFKTVVLLGGERPLRDIELEELKDCKDCKTEADMMKHLFKSNKDLESMDCILVNAPMKKTKAGKLVRPNTDDTLVSFEKANPTASTGSCLVIAENPYNTRQVKVARRVLGNAKFPVIDGAGHKAKDDINIIFVFDEVARTIYEQTKSQKIS